ncbi:3237_t:CDS:2 [Paraglomus brasilianum]|uniref:3237_t:CDS:1 n=1 Tax=Paraglomus brasilianum TaxID=144538 RepID=A0A9N9DPI7_9GLOM|nr:3237_t:CDS:2 [Paraglomus brasilianum]
MTDEKQLTELTKTSNAEEIENTTLKYEENPQELATALKVPKEQINSPFEKRAQIKRELKTLQDAIFKKKDCGTSLKIEIEREESLQNRTNPVGNPTDPKKLASLLKSDLQDILTNDSRDLDQEDYNEILSLVRQIRELGEVKREQYQQNIENIKLNNPRIFDQSRSEIISEAEAQRLLNQDKDNGRYYINYHTYVDLNDKIWIDHYQGDIKQELAKPVSGANKLIENNDHKNMSGGVITKQVEKNQQLDNEFLLKYFQENDIKEISLTPEGNLLIEYNSGKTETITNDQVNRQGLQKVISYYQKNNQTNLNQQDLINKTNSNSPATSPKNGNNSLAALVIGGVLVIGIVVGL